MDLHEPEIGKGRLKRRLRQESNQADVSIDVIKSGPHNASTAHFLTGAAFQSGSCIPEHLYFVVGRNCCLGPIGEGPRMSRSHRDFWPALSFSARYRAGLFWRNRLRYYMICPRSEVNPYWPRQAMPAPSSFLEALRLASGSRRS